MILTVGLAEAVVQSPGRCRDGTALGCAVGRAVGSSVYPGAGLQVGLVGWNPPGAVWAGVKLGNGEWPDCGVGAAECWGARAAAGRPGWDVPGVPCPFLAGERCRAGELGGAGAGAATVTCASC